MTAGTDGVSAQLASGNAQTYMNNAQQYATQASAAAATASNAAQTAASAAQAATNLAASLLALLSGTALVPQSVNDTDAIGLARGGQLLSLSYGELRDDIQDGLLQASNNLEDVESPTEALCNLGGVASNSIKSSLVTNTSNDETVSTVFSFTPGTDGLLTVISQGGSGGTNAVSVPLEIAVASATGASLLNSNCNSNGSYNIATFTAQFEVTAGEAVTVTITQTAPANTTQSNLSSFFIYLPS
jgi:hypothetical protein